MKKINQKSIDLISKGVYSLADAVKETMGPKGNNVIIEMPDGIDPIITKDGVTVAEHISFKDPFKNMGATIAKRVSERANEGSGDGTTTASVLMAAILKEGLKAVKNGHYANDVRIGINKATKKVVEKLNEQAKPVTTSDFDRIKDIATISANNDEEIGRIVAEAFQLVGDHGAVSVEEGGFTTEIDKVDGFHFDRGMASNYFSSDPTKALVSLKNPVIFFVHGKLNNKDQAISMLNYSISKGLPLVVIAEDIIGDALTTLTLNKMKGGHQICAIQTPGFGGLKKEMLLDIAAMCGGKVVTAEDVAELDEDDFNIVKGSCSSIVVDGVSTIMMGCNVDDDAVKSRVEKINEKMASNECTSFERDNLEIRIAKLLGGVAVVRVGGNSEIEVRELKDRVHDAKEAVISALEEGVVPGGGSTLLIMSKLEVEAKNDAERMGVKALMSALEAPARIIAKNAGGSPDIIVSNMILANGEQLFNAKEMTFEDIFDVKGDLKTKILDPKKVTRLALESAASSAGTLITSNVSITIDRPL